MDALHFRKEEMIRVVERVKGERIYRDYKTDWHFYVSDPNGNHKSIYGNSVKKMTPSTHGERLKLVKQSGSQTWESDMNPVFRALTNEYPSGNAPDLHVAFFDIETDFCQERGYAEPGDPFLPITSIAVYLQWIEQMVCFAVPPKTLTWDEAQEIAQQVGPEVILFKTEKEMLKAFIDIIDDADVLSGWNSEAYDIPFTINRIIRTLGKMETRKLCLWGEAPKARTFDRGGKEEPTYDLIGRVHLDYMQLYKKYNYEERHSYALNAIAEYELGDKKVEYEGTLDQLYNNDFKKFLQYNIQDTKLLDDLDKKLQFIDLASAIAHANCVLLPTTMGAVATIDNAVVIEAHERGLVCPNKRDNRATDIRAAGGWVAQPKIGLHQWIGSSDLNSLYPSVIRALNMSPETIVGQLNQSSTLHAIDDFESAAKKNTFAMWWNDRFCPLEMDKFFENNNHEKMTLNFEDGNNYEVTGAELRKIVFASGQPWNISANGTIFRTDFEGVIPGLLTRWYSERKQLQALMRIYGALLDNEKNVGYQVPPELVKDENLDSNVVHSNHYDQVQCFNPATLEHLVEEEDSAGIIDYLNKHNLKLKNGKAIFRDQAECKKIASFWDKRQLVKKISLNSAYGALLNAGSRFFDQRIGQSTTLTGRNITKHMAAKTNEMITGEYDHYGDSCIYGDTDSAYFSAYPAMKELIDAGEIEWTKESISALYDAISDEVSDTFPTFMHETFNIPIDASTGVIKAGREIVAESGLFIKKKRYAALVYDDEGTRRDVNGKAGKVKAMGLDLRRSDTPKFVQEFLSEVLLATLTRQGEDVVIEMIKKFKTKFDAMKPWEKGSPKAVNNLSKYRDKQEQALADKMAGKKGSDAMPGHVRASLNWNRLRDIHGDRHIGMIKDAQKIIVCKLKETANNRYASIAYPVDEAHLPDWFIELPFDEDAMMESVVTQKLRNLLGVLKWDLDKANKAMAHMESLFDFGQ